jgi:hypothetical protein
MWFCYDGEWMSWHTLTTDQVHEIVAKNKAKETVASIEEYANEWIVEEAVSFENVVGQDSLTRFDQPKSRNKRSKKRKPQNNTNRPTKEGAATATNTTFKEGQPKQKPRPSHTTNNKPRPNRNKSRNRDSDSNNGSSQPPKKEE